MNKERLVLAILVIFLVYRIYVVMNPTTFEEQTAQAAAAQRTAAAQAAASGAAAAPGLLNANDEDEDDEDADSAGGRLRALQGAQGGGGAQGQRPASGEQPLVFTQHMPPKRIPDPTNLPEEWTVEQGRPPAPEASPLPPSPVAYNALVKDNPFTAATDRKDVDTTGGPPNIRLLAIREWGNTYRAQIQTRTRKWYEAGESFETYQLVSIDPDAGTVEIFSEQHGRTYTYALNR